MTNADEGLACFRCGAPALWVVAVRYDAVGTAGRLMAYCDACRGEAAPRAGLVMPLSMFRLDAPTILDLAYRGGAIGTEPQGVAQAFGVAPGPWMHTARRVLDEGAAATSEG